MEKIWVSVKKRWILVSAITAIVTIITAIISFFFITPQYKSSTTLLVNQTSQNHQVQYDSILANEALVKTYSDILKSVTIETVVIHQLNLPYTTKQLNKMIEVSSPDQSQVIQVNVTTPSEIVSMNIANALAQTFQIQAQVLMQVPNVQIIDPAVSVDNPSPVIPNKILNISISFILGLMISIGLALLLEYLDNRIRTEEDVHEYLHLSVLGSITEYKVV